MKGAGLQEQAHDALAQVIELKGEVTYPKSWPDMIQAAYLWLSGHTIDHIANELDLKLHRIKAFFQDQLWPVAIYEAFSSVADDVLIYLARKNIQNALIEGDLQLSKWVLQHCSPSFTPLEYRQVPTQPGVSIDADSGVMAAVKERIAAQRLDRLEREKREKKKAKEIDAIEIAQID